MTLVAKVRKHIPVWAGGAKTCSDCGFLGWTTSPGTPYVHQDALNEVTPSQRAHLVRGVSRRVEYLFCQKRVWTTPGPLDEARAQQVLTEVIQSRRCREFFQHRPGATPERHLTYEEMNHINARSLAAGFVLGVSASIISGLVLMAVFGK